MGGASLGRRWRLQAVVAVFGGRTEDVVMSILSLYLSTALALVTIITVAAFGKNCLWNQGMLTSECRGTCTCVCSSMDLSPPLSHPPTPSLPLSANVFKHVCV